MPSEIRRHFRKPHLAEAAQTAWTEAVQAAQTAAAEAMAETAAETAAEPGPAADPEAPVPYAAHLVTPWQVHVNDVATRFAEFADELDDLLPAGPERADALKHLLYAQDHAVRAATPEQEDDHT